MAITMGDPGGIGPRLIARTLAKAPAAVREHTVVFGDPMTLEEAAALDDLRLTIETFPSVEEWARTRERQETRGSVRQGEHERAKPAVAVVNPIAAGGAEFARGQACATNGRAAVAWIEAGVQACLAGQTQALVTAPISKLAIHAAGSPWPGHTEMLAGLSGGCDVRMMLAGGGLRVVLETIHVALAKVPQLLTREHLTQTIAMTSDWSQRYLGKRARVAVCGLNPHAGEGGEFGREEIEILAPAIEDARRQGHDVSGPWPADTVFFRARRGEFDFVIAMYHDQGLVALKTVAFETGINVTLGLPFVRTSPDHGTAFDRAWERDAPINTRSFEEALRWAQRWSRPRKPHPRA